MDAASTSAEAGRRRVRVIFVGSPGAGKGTQAAKLAAYLGVPRIATGDMLRETIAKGTPLGQGAEALIGRGKLAPDDLLIALVRERAEQEDCARGFVLDGFPRTVRQAEGLAEKPPSNWQSTCRHTLVHEGSPPPQAVRPEAFLPLSVQL